MVNLAPTAPVELYTVIEELEDRVGEAQVADVLDLVESTLASAPSLPFSTDNVGIGGADAARAKKQATFPSERYADAGEDAWGDADADGQWDYDANEVVFDDMGEGAGVEGDLDMEED
jgi:hypothetical protein